MNNSFVINKKGEIVDPESYLDSGKVPKDFEVLIRREALGERLESDNKKSKYLEIAKKLGFDWELNSDHGFMRCDYKADLMMRLVKEYARQKVKEIGFPIYEVNGANLFDMSHSVVDAYAGLFGDRLYQFKSGNKQVVMSYDASYPQFNLAKQYRFSERHLPFGHFSIADCYRHEQSGECMLMLRQRRFYMPDLHPYFKDVDQAFEWFPRIEEKIMEAGKDAGVDYQIVVEVSSEANWKKYQDKIRQIAVGRNQDILVLVSKEDLGRYWIINVDYKIIDKLNQPREIACIQIDVGNAKRLGIQYLAEDGKKKDPVIIHSAVSGGIERYLYMAIDNFEHFPLWLHPVQIRLIPVSDKFIGASEEIIQANSNLPVRFEIDDRSESVSKRIKLAHKDLVPFSVVIGEKEIEEGFSGSELEKVIEEIVKASKNRPFIQASWPVKLSERFS